MVINNSWDSQIPVKVSLGGTGRTTLVANQILLGNNTSGIATVSSGSSGQILMSNGVASNPSFTTATYPSSCVTPSLLVCNTNDAITAGTTLNGGFSFSSANAGATQSLNVTNSNNSDVNSNASVVTAVGGASAGSPFFQTKVTGGQTWTFGLHQADASSFVVSSSATIGTNNAVRISTAGSVNLPLQPAFNAYLSAPVLTVTGDGTEYTIVCDTALFNVGSHYNTGTGVFTAPVGGYYYLEFSVQTSEVTAAYNTGYVSLVTTGRTYNFCNMNYYANADANEYSGVNGSMFAYLGAGDTAYVLVALGGGAKGVGVYGSANCETHFAGYLAA